ncbi:MAG TPA: hypothetical protein VD835_14700 [Pyrinomonadaceae bacterium]|nr:hypothetical protein [Pyrinomonadaceae bacterium]
MSKIVPIKSKEFLSRYRNAQGGERLPEEAVFFTGVILSTVLPQTIISIYGGLTPFVTFLSIAMGGVVWGLIMSRQTSDQTVLRVDTGTVPQTPISKRAGQKKAA